MADEDETPVFKVTQEELEKHRVPLAWRDTCAHLLIPLNKCRIRENYFPWKCKDEKHSYEKCQYEDYMRRMRAMEKIKKEKLAAANNAAT
ncbi:9334_t:CDS:2 [Ambispora gerdemannii]|uniref:NADH dehydrogenase [ubiquinone] 1 beta subcomplex subunit 7 n=1 Tax=Ambispora gerdemannii TaxID=144530 RepID=A0A9N9GMQ4_9GLOM|nr:9334_t:CDS:2 [Ambispora gerdemannii]